MLNVWCDPGSIWDKNNGGYDLIKDSEIRSFISKAVTVLIHGSKTF